MNYFRENSGFYLIFALQRLRFMMKALIFGNNYKRENLSLLPTLLDLLQSRSYTTRVERAFLNYIVAQGFDLPADVKPIMPEDLTDANFAISMGGDGTFLRTASQVGRAEIPIVGINTGRLGFLADIASQNVREPFERILDGDYYISDRTPIVVEATDDKNKETLFGGYNVGLNEVAVLKQDTSSMITISAYLDDIHLLDYQADGLVISTPTGSTAYNMSVGGPIVMPGSHNLTLSPVAPHSLTLRPLVITDQYKVRLSVQSRSEHFLASVDGRSSLMDNGTDLIIRKADFKVRIIKQHKDSFISTLKDKLLWGADKR